MRSSIAWCALLAAILFSGCTTESPERAEFQKQYRRLWNEKLSIAERTQVEDAIIAEARNMPGPDEFILYTHERMTDEEIADIRGKYAILDFVEDAFDRVLTGVKNDQVPPGQVYIYYVYNLGYVIKTPTLTIGLDICHRRGEELVPYLDLAVITHNHEDHCTQHFINAVNKAKKHLICNFHSGSAAKLPYGPGYSKEPYRELHMPGLTIRTYESDHLTYQWFKYNMPVEFDLKTGDKECVIFSGGDSCDTMQLKCSKAPDIYIAHPRVGGDIIHGALLLGAKCTFISHLMELQHRTYHAFNYKVGYSEQKLLLTNHLIGAVPHWGDKYVWPLSLDEADNYNLHLPNLPPEKPVRIMPIGDSITRGSWFGEVKNATATSLGGGYRKPLQEKLRTIGYPYQFVGELAYWAYGEVVGSCDPEFQRYHHGLSGFSNKMIREGGTLPYSDNVRIFRDKSCKQLSVPGIEESLRRWKPDVILLMSGTNGFNAAERNKLIDTIARNFSGTLLVATIPPQKAPSQGVEQVDEYNRSLAPFLAASHPHWKCRVFPVDVNSKLDKDDLLPDGVHPTQAGLNKIAGAWFEAIKKYCPQKYASADLHQTHFD